MRILKIELGVCRMPGRVSASQQPLPTVLFLDTNLLCCSGLILHSQSFLLSLLLSAGVSGSVR